GEMRVSIRGQGEVAFIELRIARLLERTQHQERQHALFRLAGDLLHQLLVHARGYVDFFRQLDGRGAAAGFAVVALAIPNRRTPRLLGAPGTSIKSPDW